MRSGSIEPPTADGRLPAELGEWDELDELDEENVMALLHVKVIEGVFDEAQKRDMVEKLTDTMVEIEGEAMRPVTWVFVEEVTSGLWGIGGQPMTTADVKALGEPMPVW